MRRTAEQIAADEALTDAIDRTIDAYHEQDGAISLEYIAIVARQRIDDDGEPEYSFNTIFRDGCVPTTRALGLLAGAEKTLGADQDE